MINLSNKINPFNYDNKPLVDVIVLDCVNCGCTKQVKLPHSTSNTTIMTKHFIGWKAEGYRNQKKTLCPDCAKK
jgi:hypothetical protein